MVARSNHAQLRLHHENYVFIRHLTCGKKPSKLCSNFDGEQLMLEAVSSSLNHVRKIDAGKCGRIGVAFSGGVDSTALAILLRKCLSTQPVAETDWQHNNGLCMAPLMLTVDHQLRSESADEARRAAAIATHLEFDHLTLKVNWSQYGKGSIPVISQLQEAAREARYSILLDACFKNDISVLLTAHTVNDQIETFLQRFARNSNLYGLRGIDKIKTVHQHDNNLLPSGSPLHIIRPLLKFSRKQMEAVSEAYSRDSKSQFPMCIHDPSNNNLLFDRVRVRKALSRSYKKSQKNENEDDNIMPLDHMAISRLMDNIRIAASSLEDDATGLFMESCKIIEPYGSVGLDLSMLFPCQYRQMSESDFSSNSILSSSRPLPELVTRVLKIAIQHTRRPKSWPPPGQASIQGMYSWIFNNIPEAWDCRAVAGIIGTVFSTSDVDLAQRAIFNRNHADVEDKGNLMLVFHSQLQKGEVTLPNESNFMPLPCNKEIVWSSKYKFILHSSQSNLSNINDRTFGLAPQPRRRFTKCDRSILRICRTLEQGMPAVYEKFSTCGNTDEFKYLGSTVDFLSKSHRDLTVNVDVKYLHH